MTSTATSANSLKIEQVFKVGAEIFNSEAEAQDYARKEQLKKEAVEILSNDRKVDHRRMGLEMENKAVVEMVAKHLDAFAEIVTLLQEAK
jgi:hypothetical protein